MTELLHASVAGHAKIEVEAGPEPVWVDADATQIRQVVMNFIINASEALRGDVGRVTLRTGIVHADHAYLESCYTREDLDEGEFALLEVSDDGIGMDLETATRIFDPFFTTKGKGGGTGLGLAVVYGIVEAHGGRIRVRSETGYGSEFIVHWPAATETSGDVRAFPPEAAAGEGTILVAEDEPGVRHLACRALERAGYRVLEAEDGEGALEVYRRHREEVDLLVLDLSMPRLDGLSALARIRAQAPQLPALIMSGHPDRGRPAAWPSDASLLEKPFGPRQLLARVAELLGEG